MFTGIVEEVGTVRSVLPGERAGRIGICARTVLEGTQIGDSIAVNGVCLTVVDMGADFFTADVMPETLSKTGLGKLAPGSPVNLERAMAANGRFGGHIVSGHIDGVGVIEEMVREQNAVWVRVKAPAGILALIVDKGSIAIDGISLTVAGVTETSFQVSVIPHTGAQTILLGKRPGDVVNLENDIVGKYVQKLLGSALGQGRAESTSESKLTMAFLEANGF